MTEITTKKVLKGRIQEDNVQMGVGEYFWQTAEKYGERICQIHAETDEKETFEEVKLRAVRVALHMKRLGIRPKDVVMVCSENDLDPVVPVVASLFLGAYVVSSLPFLELFDIQCMIADTKPKLIVTQQQQLDLVELAINNEKLTSKIWTFEDIPGYPSVHKIQKIKVEVEKYFRPMKVDIYDTAFILFSSGTTSTPKGICMSHYSVLAGPCRANGIQSYLLDAPIFQATTLYWISAVWIFGYSIINGQPRIVAPLIIAEKYYELIDKYKVMHLFLTYSSVASIVNLNSNLVEKYDLSCVKYVSTGGSYVDIKYIKKLRTIFPNAVVVQSYASTELGSMPISWTTFDTECYAKKPNSVGTVGPNVEIKVVDIISGQRLGPDATGELLVKSPYTMIGYYNKTRLSPFDEEGFLKTGDLAYYDNEGCFFIVDRLNDVLKYRGLNISPKIIENVLMTHPSVQEAAVFGIRHDVDFSHPAACIVLKENRYVTEEEISDFIVKNLAELYRLRGGIKVLKSLPVTANGKISRKEAKRIFLSEIM